MTLFPRNMTASAAPAISLLTTVLLSTLLLTTLLLTTLLLTTSSAAGANPCTHDRSFAEANDCSEVYDAHRAPAVDRTWVPNGRVR